MSCPTERKIARTSRGEDIYAYTDSSGKEQYFVVPLGCSYICRNGKWEVYQEPTDWPTDLPAPRLR